MISKQQVAGMVTLYNSQATILLNIKTYIDQLDKLFIIDNSDSPDKGLVAQLIVHPKIQYHYNGENRGIGYALNMAAKLARKQGYLYLLTMDDDSCTPPGLIDTMLTFLQKYKGGKVGVVSAAHGTAGLPLDYKVVDYTMTSGNLIDLAIHEKEGGFWEELFIDHIDHDYGLRLTGAGYQIIELPSMPLNHSLGLRKNIFPQSDRWRFVSHSPVRMYYIARNGWLVAQRHIHTHRSFSRVVRNLIVKEWMKAIFFEDKRWQRVHLLTKGMFDAFLGRTGKLK